MSIRYLRSVVVIMVEDDGAAVVSLGMERRGVGMYDRNGQDRTSRGLLAMVAICCCGDLVSCVGATCGVPALGVKVSGPRKGGGDGGTWPAPALSGRGVSWRLTYTFSCDGVQ